MPTLMFAHVHFYNINMWLIMWAWSRNVEAVLLATLVLFLSPAMPNLDIETATGTTLVLVIKQFRRLSIANQGKSNIDKNTCKPSLIFADLMSSSRLNISWLQCTCNTWYILLDSTSRFHLSISNYELGFESRLYKYMYFLFKIQSCLYLIPACSSSISFFT